jgi:hypothetical protein
MHCPQCGQQQKPGEVRFCSVCGFPLGGVSELLTHGGIPPNYVQAAEPQTSPRRTGVKHGVMLIMLGIITTIFFGVLNSYLFTPEFLTAIAAVIGFVGGPLRILYALIFEEGATRQQPTLPAYMPPNLPASLPGQMQHTALPPHHSTHAPSFRPPQHTAEIVRPHSVTEGTTRLLEKEPEPPER